MTYALQLDGKRALVTGASKGIGAAIAATLRSAGAIVLATARSPAAGFGEPDLYVAADVATSPESGPADSIVAPTDLKMRLAIELRRRTGNPILLVDEMGCLAGFCGDDEIYRALLRARLQN